ncbi:hypothetical protein MHLP_01650 [Candidatus Mycoplasma haematolamae str. Purdue]|uniref:Uncharacterized protein n=1 Tax=Mycoplasma haematolamae (strain Purdue) TaxID=1212765 RepID=I7B9F7_MYCHA|nr:hypothetical protein MHLP_01650 [Candidatus Mycoplasma haematolamae str. Purdue]
MLLSPFKVVGCVLVGGGVVGTSVYGITQLGGGQLALKVGLHKETHNTHKEGCEGDVCDHAIECANNHNGTALSCGHKCLEDFSYKGFLNDQERQKVFPDIKITVYNTYQECPENPKPTDLYKSGSFNSACPNPKITK